MHCNGKCYLMKQMKKQDKKENAPVNTLKGKFENQLPADSFSYRLMTNCIIIHHSFLYTALESSSHLHSIFRPPVC